MKHVHVFGAVHVPSTQAAVQIGVEQSEPVHLQISLGWEGSFNWQVTNPALQVHVFGDVQLPFAQTDVQIGILHCAPVHLLAE